MSQLILNEVATPSTPASGKGSLYMDSTTSLPAYKNDGGRCGLAIGQGSTFNAAIAAQGAGFAADTFVTDSDLLIPNFGLQVRTAFRWTISASKTAAGVATPIYTIRIGSGRATTDTSILALTGPAQTAVADIGTLTVLCSVRAIGASAVIAGTAWWVHRGTAANTTTSGTGFANDSSGHVEGTSGTFNSASLAGQYISLTLNGGTSAAWTLTQCVGEALW